MCTLCLPTSNNNHNGVVVSNMIYPEDIARAIFPCSVKSNSKWDYNDKQTKSNCHREAIDIVCQQLQPFFGGKMPRTLTKNPKPLLGVPANLTLSEGQSNQFNGHRSYKGESNCKIYCPSCMTNVGTSKFHCFALAQINYNKTESEERECAVVNVTHVYPHNNECMQESIYRSNFSLSTYQNGIGSSKYIIRHYPSESIEGGLFTDITKRLLALKYEDLDGRKTEITHPGE